MDKIKDAFSQIVENSKEKLSPPALVKIGSQLYSIQRKTAKSAIKDLVEEGKLVYSYEYGQTFLEKSYAGPIKISPRVVLKPPDRKYIPATDEAVITLFQGASFGAGQHPTTRLAIRGIEFVLKDIGFLNRNKPSATLDIGTGTGILGITAIGLGIHHGIGLDIDPLAIHEARINARLNGLSEKFSIQSESLEQLDDTFDLITANLRYPTLRRICPMITAAIQPGGAVVLSGLRPGETDDLISVYTGKNQFHLSWESSEKDWVGLAFLQKEGCGLVL